MRTKHTTTLCKRLGAWALTLALVVGLLPQTAFAAGTDSGKAIQLGVSGIKDPTVEGSTYYTPSSYIYFGVNESEPIKWRVLDADKTNDETTSGMFLLSEYLLTNGVKFNENYSDGNQWQHSDAQAWCNTFYSGNLTTQEQGAVLATTKSDRAYISASSSYAYGVSSLSGDKVFFLSAEEAENSAYGFIDNAARIASYGNRTGVWWLRSPTRPHWTSRRSGRQRSKCSPACLSGSASTTK